MYYHPYVHLYSYYANNPSYRYNPYVRNLGDNLNQHDWNSSNRSNRLILEDHGNQPFVIDIEDAAEQNNTFRTALWTGNHLQVALMSINVGEDIGLEVHPSTDQFLRIEEGRGVVQMGNSEENLTFRRNVGEDDAIMVPAGTWHNLINTGNQPLKLYTIYAPPEHPFGTVHITKAESMSAE
jgi:mannose-6-phosphate isomerase-like protein (cupin superfamily)